MVHVEKACLAIIVATLVVSITVVQWLPLRNSPAAPLSLTLFPADAGVSVHPLRDQRKPLLLLHSNNSLSAGLDLMPRVKRKEEGTTIIDARQSQRDKSAVRRACLVAHPLEILPKTPVVYPNRGKYQSKLLSRIQRGAQICPQLLPNGTRSRGRRIFVDVGASDFSTSPLVFLTWYKATRSFEWHAIEANEARAASYLAQNRRRTVGENTSITFHHMALGQRNGFLSFRKGEAHEQNFQSDGQLTSTSSAAVFHLKRDDSPADAFQTVRARSACAFFLDDLNVSADDYLIVKIDIEGGEWVVLNTIDEQCPHLWPLLDEFFLECHYKGMARVFDATPFSKCASVMEDLRKNHSIFVHDWI